MWDCGVWIASTDVLHMSCVVSVSVLVYETDLFIEPAGCLLSSSLTRHYPWLTHTGPLYNHTVRKFADDHLVKLNFAIILWITYAKSLLHRNYFLWYKVIYHKTSRLMHSSFTQKTLPDHPNMGRIWVKMSQRMNECRSGKVPAWFVQSALSA